MPLPLLLAGISAGANLLGGAVNAFSQSATNRSQQRFSREIYARQRADALSDWQMQNAYNDPSAQMARLKMAGLNPNLVYGNGATTESAPMRSSTFGGYSPKAPELPVGDALGSGVAAYQDARLKQAQIDNLSVRNENLAEDTRLKAARGSTELVMQALNALRSKGQVLSNEGRSIANAKAGSLLASQLEAASLSLRQQKASLLKSGAEIDYLTGKNRREEAINASDLISRRLLQSKTAVETRQLEQGLQNMMRDGALKDLELELKRSGATWSDPLWQRNLFRLWDKYMKPLSGSPIDRFGGFLQKSLF